MKGHRSRKRFLILLGLAFIFLYGILYFSHQSLLKPSGQDNDAPIAIAYRHHISGIHVTGTGVVLRLLPDDTADIRHQRFIVRLPWGQTLLMVHNIDMAPKIKNLKPGDIVEFSGEYEWNPKGGIVHQTHHAPNRRHRNGWIKHKGHLYE